MRTLCPLLLVAMAAGGCASTPADEVVEHDPWEPMNRGLYGFNQGVDKISFKPLAKGYVKIIPSPVRRSITNFSRNLSTPGSAINNFLQGKPAHGLQELSRFFVNSTIGIGGLFDIASRSGVEAHPEDFGQTAAVWGIPSGPFVMLPLFGPQTLRDAVTLPLNIAADPLRYYDDDTVRISLWLLRLVDLRARLLPLEGIVQDSADPYITMRESYLQNRAFEIYDGDPPVEEDEDFYDDFLDEEDY
jgi:phospholipid-binding lipoprotein MlaA